MKVLLVPGGGSGGHIFPAVALAEAFEKKGATDIVFLGTKRGLMQKFLSETKWRFLIMDAPSFADKIGWRKMTAFLSLGRSFLSAFQILKRENPDVVIGVGGYVSFPVLVAASMQGKTTWTVEPNAKPGLANRYLKYFVEHIVVAYSGMETFFNPKKMKKWGVPIRAHILSPVSSCEAPATGRQTILLMGGSQGAQSLNTMMWETLPHLAGIKEKIHFIHQLGFKEDCVSAKKKYEAFGFSAEVYPFIEEMGSVLARSHFAIARAGGNTVAELMASGLPSLLVPYPHSKDRHQEANAKALEKMGGAKVCLESELTPESLATFLQKVIEEPEMLKQMRKNLEAFGFANAAQKVVEACLEESKHHV